jgi:hypothetical protein
MDTHETERFARRFHEVYGQLRQSHAGVAPVRWADMPPEKRQLLIATAAVVLGETESASIDAQKIEFDRNHWQRKVGILLALIESHVESSDKVSGPASPSSLRDAARKAVNTNWYTDSIDEEPLFDIAKMTVDQTIQTAVDAGIVKRVTNGAG